MYHDNQPFTVELPDSVDKVEEAFVVEMNGAQYLHVVAKLRSDQRVSDALTGLRLHMTNGVNHHYIDLENRGVASEEAAKKGKK